MKKNRKKIMLQNRNNRCTQFRNLVTTIVELENRLKAMEENFNINDSEIN